MTKKEGVRKLCARRGSKSVENNEAQKLDHFKSISGSNRFKTRYVIDNGRTCSKRDLQAVNFTTVIIPLLILVPSFRKVPLQILPGFVFRNDEKVA